MNALKNCLIVLSLFIGISMGRISHHRRSGSFPDASCTATLKSPDGKNARHIKWDKPYKSNPNNWQHQWPAGREGVVVGTLFVRHGEETCSVDFDVDLNTCSFSGIASNTIFTGAELHHSQPSPLDSKDGITGSIRWNNCPAGMGIHLDF